MREAPSPLSPAELAAILGSLASGGSCCDSRPDPLSLLREDSPIYSGRGASEAERLRGFVMVALARAGFGDALAPYVLEELETGTNPYTVAAAARAARMMPAVPEEAVDLLPAAIDRIRHADEFVHLEDFPAPPGVGPKTAVAEAIETLGAAGSSGRAAIEALWRRASGTNAFSPAATAALEAARRQESRPADCCAAVASATRAEPGPIASSIDGLRDVEFENQDGVRASFAEIFSGRSCVIAFFYTRCMNPDKCSRTISKLARVNELIEQRLPDRSAMVAGISYDPAYDVAERLHRYGSDRGMRFGPLCQLLRTTGSFAPLRTGLQLGVGYGSATVNRHRIELILLDPAGKIADFKARRLWDENDVADALVGLDLPAPHAATRCIATPS